MAVAGAVCAVAARAVRAEPSDGGPGAACEPADRWKTLPPTPDLPPAASTGLVSRRGAKLFHASFGDGDPVLLLHGGLANANWWGHLVRALAPRFRVIVMDARGHGRSTLGDPPLTYEALASDAAAVLDACGVERAAVVGWSDGGIAGLQMAMTQPGRVSRLFAFGANASPDGLRAGGASSPVVKEFTRRCETEYAALAKPAQLGALRKALTSLWRSGPNFSPAQLGRIGVPVTVADGERDELVMPAHPGAIARAIPKSSLVIEPCVSHFAMVQDPGQFASDVLRFLAQPATE